MSGLSRWGPTDAELSVRRRPPGVGAMSGVDAPARLLDIGALVVLKGDRYGVVIDYEFHRKDQDTFPVNVGGVTRHAVLSDVIRIVEHPRIPASRQPSDAAALKNLTAAR